MIKGVNKQIIEISDTGSKSFERAILFVRPNSRGLDSETLDGYAKEYLSQIKLRPSIYARRMLWGAWGRILLGVLLGGSITAGVLWKLFIG